ncbi:MAG: hypothetical protein M0018_11210 [Nitrospiraceae bacterium]|nr:hypothetical protein [Nitrospiraceae bacterium]
MLFENARRILTVFGTRSAPFVDDQDFKGKWFANSKPLKNRGLFCSTFLLFCFSEKYKSFKIKRLPVEHRRQKDENMEQMEQNFTRKYPQTKENSEMAGTYKKKGWMGGGKSKALTQYLVPAAPRGI